MKIINTFILCQLQLLTSYEKEQELIVETKLTLKLCVVSAY